MTAGPVLKAAYSVTELAGLLGWSRTRTRRYLKRKGIGYEVVGKLGYVWLSSLKDQAPDAWASILCVAQAQADMVSLGTSWPVYGQVRQLGTVLTAISRSRG